MRNRVRSSAPEAVAGTCGLRPGRSAGQQSGLGSCSSGCRRWTDPTIWAKPTHASERLYFGALVCQPSMRALHAARRTCSGDHAAHAIHCAAHAAPTFHRTEHAAAGPLLWADGSVGARVFRRRRASSTRPSCRRTWRWPWTTFPSFSRASCASACDFLTVRPGSIPAPRRRVEPYLAEFLDDCPLQQRRPQVDHSFVLGDDDASAWRHRRRRSRDGRRDSARAALFRRLRGRQSGAEAARGRARAAGGQAGALQRAAGSGPSAPGRGTERSGPAGPVRRAIRPDGAFVTLLLHLWCGVNTGVKTNVWLRVHVLDHSPKHTFQGHSLTLGVVSGKNRSVNVAKV